MSVRLIAVLVVVVLLAVAQADPGWAGRAGVPVPSGPAVRGLAPLTVVAQDDNENENGNDNSADDDDDTDDDGGDDGDNSDDGDGDNGDGDDDADNDDGTDDDDDDDNGNTDDDDDDDDNGNDNEGNENDDGDDDNGNGNDNDADDLDNDNGDDETVIAIPPPPGQIVISAPPPPPAPRYAPAPRPEPVVVEEPYLTEASAISEGGDAEVRIGKGKVVVRLFSSLGSGVTVTVRFADPAALAPIPGGPAGDLVFVVEAHAADGAPLASLPVEVNLNVRYDDGDVAGLNEEGLVISHLDPGTGSWRPAPRLIRDTVTRFLAASITELGAYVVHAP